MERVKQAQTKFGYEPPEASRSPLQPALNLSAEMCAFWKEGYFSYTYAKYLPVLKFVSGNANFLEGGYFSYMCAK